MRKVIALAFQYAGWTTAFLPARLCSPYLSLREPECASASSTADVHNACSQGVDPAFTHQSIECVTDCRVIWLHQPKLVRLLDAKAEAKNFHMVLG